MDEKNTPEAFGTLVEDFFSVKIPTETHFTDHLLAERLVSNARSVFDKVCTKTLTLRTLTSIDFRLQVYKYFKLEQLLQELKPTLKDRHGDGKRF